MVKSLVVSGLLRTVEDMFNEATLPYVVMDVACFIITTLSHTNLAHLLMGDMFTDCDIFVRWETASDTYRRDPTAFFWMMNNLFSTKSLGHHLSVFATEDYSAWSVGTEIQFIRFINSNLAGRLWHTESMVNVIQAFPRVFQRMRSYFERAFVICESTTEGNCDEQQLLVVSTVVDIVLKFLKCDLHNEDFSRALPFLSAVAGRALHENREDIVSLSIPKKICFSLSPPLFSVAQSSVLLFALGTCCLHEEKALRDVADYRLTCLIETDKGLQITEPFIDCNLERILDTISNVHSSPSQKDVAAHILDHFLYKCSGT